jgi:hypothetical protein
MTIINVTKTLGFPGSLGGGKLALVKEDGHLNLEFKGSQDSKSVRARRTIRLKGETTLPRSYPEHSFTYQYLVDNYDSFTAYDGSCSAGSISVTGEGVMLTTPVSGEKLYITVNGELSVVNLRSAVVKKPIITYPIEGGSNIPLAFNVEVPSYEPEVPTEPFERVEWMVATDVNFTQVVRSYSETSPTPLLSLPVVGLSSNTPYYLRVRFKGSLSGFSEWSTVVNFTTVLSEVSNIEQAKLTASDGALGDNFGCLVALSSDGNTLITGSVIDDNDYTDSGSAYIYVRSGSLWSQQAKLLPSDQGQGDLFGSCVAVSGDGNTVAISSHFDDDKGSESGSVYIFKRTGSSWAQEAKIVPVDGASNDRFGFYVSLSRDGNTVAAAAFLDDDAGVDSGSVYVFVRSGSTWSQQAKLIGSDIGAGEYFGHRVALSGDGMTLAVASVYESTNGDQSGAAYIYTRTGTVWTQQAKLTPSDPAVGDLFGRGLALSGDGNTLIAGASPKGVGGCAYVFVRVGSNWSQQTKLAPVGVIAGESVGFAVSISYDGKIAAVGARFNRIKGSGAGAVYVYTRSGAVWSLKNTLTASDGAPNDNFGYTVSLNETGNTLAVGSPYDDDKGTDSGSAYVFI